MIRSSYLMTPAPAELYRGAWSMLVRSWFRRGSLREHVLAGVKHDAESCGVTLQDTIGPAVYSPSRCPIPRRLFSREVYSRQHQRFAMWRATYSEEGAMYKSLRRSAILQVNDGTRHPVDVADPVTRWVLHNAIRRGHGV